MKKALVLLISLITLVCISAVFTFAATPKKVTDFTEKSATDTTVVLSWKKTKSADGYIIYKYNSGTKKYEKVTKTSSLQYTVKKLSPGKTYKFKIRAYKGKENGEMSDALTVYTAAAKVTGLKNSSATPTSIKLTWKKSTGATGYKVYKYNASKKKYEVIKSLMDTSVTVSSLATKTNYKFCVEAYRTGGSKVYTSTKSDVLLTGTSTSKPTAAKVGSITTSSAKISFDTVKGAAGYVIQVSSDSKFGTSTTKTVTKSSVKFTSLNHSTKYYVRLRTYRTVNDVKIYSPYSSVKTFNTVEIKPVDIVKDSVTTYKGCSVELDTKLVDSSLKITWSTSNRLTATVSKGVVTAKKVGNVTITATVTYNGKKYSDSVNIVIKDPSTLKCYPDAKSVPDFGAAFGVEGVNISEQGMIAYAYVESDFGKTGIGMDAAIEEYKGMIEGCGFDDLTWMLALAGDLLSDMEGEIEVKGLFMKGDCCIMLAKETEQNAFVVGIMNISDIKE